MNYCYVITGGEGALIASAGAVIGIGNDLGGSIRIPSAFCGIYGHKPSEGMTFQKYILIAMILMTAAQH